ncbi:hypothetical protein Cgig2_006853 [Carnegiea gigantea]|uniref:Denticleless protein homolog n=1 Tax=Carnegiea gigantea TaxID=171969 RepID=A0A9Q1Q8J3_9CARY|nr:hypothetical protein Cgig2_006853 [Carnegiea gigantea]
MEVCKSQSVLHDIKSRELHGFRGSKFQSLFFLGAGRKRPLFTYNGSKEDENDDPSSSSRAIATAHNGISSPPLAVSFAKTIKNAHILGVTDEEGYVSLIDTRAKLKPSATHEQNAEKAIVSSWVAHDNSVYEICWIKDDTHMLTASADHTIKVWDVQQKRCNAVLRGHTGSVKSVCCHPTNSDLIVSGSRDGSFALWDLRCNPGQGRQWITPIGQVNGAHITVKRKRFMKGKAASMTVTSVLYLKDELSIATAGAVNSFVKVWDSRSLRVPATQACPHHESTIEINGRSHGITSLSQDHNGVMLAASCTDNRIYLYNALQLEKGPISSFTGSQIGSFFVKAAISPDASHILSGSGDGNAYIWQVRHPHKDPIALTSHEKEVTAVNWCPNELGKIATASDDFTVRFWDIQTRYCPSPRSPFIRRKVIEVPTNGYEELSLGRTSPRSSSHEEVVEQDPSSAELMKTPEGSTAYQCHKNRLLLGVNLNEAFDKTPEAAVRSPSSVLTPPSSTKKRTIRDYFLVS